MFFEDITPFIISTVILHHHPDVRTKTEYSQKTFITMNDMTFRVRPYSKRELAKMYFPDTAQAETAVANLRNLMRRNHEMTGELAAAGYRLRDKVFTPRQVAIIVHYLGEP